MVPKTEGQRRGRGRGLAAFWFDHLLIWGPWRMFRNLLLWLRLRSRRGDALVIEASGFDLVEVPRPQRLLNLCTLFVADSASPGPQELTPDLLRRVAAAFPGTDVVDADFEEVRRACLDEIREAAAANTGPSIVGGRRLVWWEHDAAGGRILAHACSPARWRLTLMRRMLPGRRDIPRPG